MPATSTFWRMSSFCYYSWKRSIGTIGWNPLTSITCGGHINCSRRHGERSLLPNAPKSIWRNSPHICCFGQAMGGLPGILLKKATQFCPQRESHSPSPLTPSAADPSLLLHEKVDLVDLLNAAVAMPERRDLSLIQNCFEIIQRSVTSFTKVTHTFLTNVTAVI